MNKLVSTVLCSLAAAVWALPATANEADKDRAGANASVEGGVGLGGTGVTTKAGAGGTVKQQGAADSQPRTSDKADPRPGTQAEQDEGKNKRKNRAQRKSERDASSGAMSPGKTY